MLHLAEQIDAAAAIVRSQWAERPVAGIILGSGLGGLAREIDAAAKIDYAELPHFPRSTAVGHAGRLVCGTLAGRPVVAFQGRFHLYEGWTAEQASLPVRLAKALGAGGLIVSNAAGGLNPLYRVGDVMLIDDQINLMFANPLIGVNDDDLGPRFPDMCAPYDRQLQEVAMAAALEHRFVLHRGVYVGMLGPTYETRAEYRMCRRLGGDAVGMSTVPEVVAAVHAGMRVAGVSTITNAGTADALDETDHSAVTQIAGAAAERLGVITRAILQAL
ncbi:MAG: purine-nucleoside phosphorylase [Planctomycetaceae bacterium]|nr:purine-nucleoside phosphorylase [Planctomycetaceae bacterium]